ncbi:MAG: hypothetical protein ACLPN1_06845 [Dissulfurispiraceae bacterium]|jgi:hypothetical protein
MQAHRKGVNNMTVTKNIGMLLLGIWLILIGLVGVIGGGIITIHTLLDILAIAAGAFILIGR